MPRGEKDHGANWLIQNQATALVRLLGLAPRTCRTVHPRLTLPQAIPDGLLELTLPDFDRPVPLLLEIETYPSADTNEQMSRDLDLAALALGKLPDAAVIVPCRRGKNQVAQRTQQSLLGWSQRKHRWRVLELWNVPAEQLLAMNEVGLLPLIPLTDSRESPELLFRQCWERIDRQARREQRKPMLAITTILAGLRYTEAETWLAALGGKSMLAESPIYQKWMAEAKCEADQAAILRVLRARLGEIPEEVAVQVRSIADREKLEEILDHAAVCKSIADFRKRLAHYTGGNQVFPRPAPR